MGSEEFSTFFLFLFIRVSLGAHQKSGEGVVRRNGCPKGCFRRVRFLSAPLRLSCVLRANLKGAEKKRTLQKHPFGQPFVRMTPSPLLWRALIWGSAGPFFNTLFYYGKRSAEPSCRTPKALQNSVEPLGFLDPSFEDRHFSPRFFAFFCFSSLFSSFFGNSQKGGETYRAILGGGKHTIKHPLQNQFWRPQKVGFVWSVPTKENDIAQTKGGGNRIISGGVQNRFWGEVLWYVFLGKIQRGAHKRGLKPQIFRENQGEILPGKSGLFGANWRHFRAGRGLFGADQDQFLCTSQPRGKSRNCPERALFGPIGRFRAKPSFAEPPFGFPRFPLP